MEAINFAGLTTAFSGIQLAVVVFAYVELRNLKSSVSNIEKNARQQDAHISKLGSRLSHVMGRLKIDDNGDD